MLHTQFACAPPVVSLLKALASLAVIAFAADSGEGDGNLIGVLAEVRSGDTRTDPFAPLRDSSQHRLSTVFPPNVWEQMNPL